MKLHNMSGLFWTEETVLKLLVEGDSVWVEKLTCEHAHDSSGDGELGLGLVGGRADLDALESEHGHDHGAEAEQQTDDHQSPTRLDVSCTERDRCYHHITEPSTDWIILESNGTRQKKDSGFDTNDQSLCSVHGNNINSSVTQKSWRKMCLNLKWIMKNDTELR